MRERVRREHRFTVTPEHLTLDPRISDRAHRLWCRLDRIAAGADNAPSFREELAVEIGCSLASIDRAIRELVDAGWLRVERTGSANVYTLIVAPERAVLRLVEEAREKRRETLGKQRPRRTSPQVNEGRVVTADESRRVVTADESESSRLTSRVVTADDSSSYRDKEKELNPPTPRGDAGEPAAADATARGDATDSEALFDPPPSGRSPRPGGKASDPHTATARRLCAAWWDALPVKPSGSKTFLGVVTLVAQDLAGGRTEDEIETALRDCGVAVTRNALNFRYERARSAASPRPSGIRSQGYLADPAADFFAGGTTRTA